MSFSRCFSAPFRVFSLVALAITVASPALAQAHAQSGAQNTQRESVYTSIRLDDPDTTAKEGDCAIDQTFHNDGVYHLREHCGTVAGIKLIVHTGDQRRQWVSLQRPGEPETEIFLPDLFGQGALTTLPSNVVEWRGVRIAGRFEPSALIVRSIRESLDENGELRKVGELLAVIRIEPKAICLLGAVDARLVGDANAAAREKADSPLPCL